MPLKAERQSLAKLRKRLCKSGSVHPFTLNGDEVIAILDALKAQDERIDRLFARLDVGDPMLG